MNNFEQQQQQQVEGLFPAAVYIRDDDSSNSNDNAPMYHQYQQDNDNDTDAQESTYGYDSDYFCDSCGEESDWGSAPEVEVIIYGIPESVVVNMENNEVSERDIDRMSVVTFDNYHESNYWELYCAYRRMLKVRRNMRRNNNNFDQDNDDDEVALEGQMVSDNETEIEENDDSDDDDKDETKSSKKRSFEEMESFSDQTKDKTDDESHKKVAYDEARAEELALKYDLDMDYFEAQEFGFTRAELASMTEEDLEFICNPDYNAPWDSKLTEKEMEEANYACLKRDEEIEAMDIGEEEKNRLLEESGDKYVEECLEAQDRATERHLKRIENDNASLSQ